MSTFQLLQDQSSQLTFVDEVKSGSVSSAGNKRSVDKTTKAKEVSNHSPQPPLQGQPPTGDVSLCPDSSILMTRPPSTRYLPYYPFIDNSRVSVAEIKNIEKNYFK